MMILAALSSARARRPIVKQTLKPMATGKFGYDVACARPYSWTGLQISQSVISTHFFDEVQIIIIIKENIIIKKLSQNLLRQFF